MRRKSASPVRRSAGHITPLRPTARHRASSFCCGVPAGVPRYQTNTRRRRLRRARGQRGTSPAPASTLIASGCDGDEGGLQLPEVVHGVAREGDQQILDVDRAALGMLDRSLALRCRQ